MKVLITGATGHFGGNAVEHVLKTLKPENVAVSVRDLAKAEGLKAKGVDVRQGNFDEPEALVKTFEGIDKLLLVSTDGDTETRIRQHSSAIEAAKKAGVKHIVYTSVANAPNSSLSLAEVHRHTEEAIVNSGISYTFLRNNWYLENEVSSMKAAGEGAPWVTSAGSGKVGWSLRREYAEAAANVLVSENHENAIYELSGKAHSQEELAQAVGKALGKDVSVLQLDDSAYEAGLQSAGLPGFVVELLVGIQKAIREGALDVTNSDLEKLLGHPALSLEEAVSELVKGF